MAEWLKKGRFLWPLSGSACAKAASLVARSLYSNLSWAERVRLRLHLALCGLCAENRKQLEWMQQLLRRDIEKEAEDPGNSNLKLSDEARQRIKKALEEQLKKNGKSA
jgi:hypothetical protein